MRDEGVVLPPSFLWKEAGLRFLQDKHILLKITEPIEPAEPYFQIPDYYEKDDS